MFMAALGERNFLTMLLAISIPVLSGVSQYVSIKLTAPNQTAMVDSDNPMATSMGSMNKIMPLFSVFIGFTMPAGLGLYWIVSAVVRSIQQILINKHLAKTPIEELIAKNQEKAAKKREKKGITANKINEMAQKNARNIKETTISDEEREKKLTEAKEKNKNAKTGSLAARANLAKKYNENEK